MLKADEGLVEPSTPSLCFPSIWLIFVLLDVVAVAAVVVVVVVVVVVAVVVVDTPLLAPFEFNNLLFAERLDIRDDEVTRLVAVETRLFLFTLSAFFECVNQTLHVFVARACNIRLLQKILLILVLISRFLFQTSKILLKAAVLARLAMIFIRDIL